MTAALSGEFGPAQRALRIQFDDNYNAAQNFQRMLDRISQVSAGQASEALKTLGGQYEQHKKKVEEMKEALGKLALEGFAKVYDAAKKLDEFFTARQAGQQSARVRGGLQMPNNPADFAALQATIAAANASTPAPLLISGTAAGQAAMSGSAGGIDVHNLEQEKQALLELNRLQAQLRTQGLEGLDRERAEALKLDEEQTNSMLKLMNLDQMGGAEKLRRLSELDAATLRSLDLIEKRRQEALDKESISEMKAAQERAKAEMDLQEEITASQLKGQDLEVFTEEANHEKRLERIRSMQFENEDDYLKLIGLENQLHAVKSKNIDDQHDALVQFGNDMKEVGKQAEELFAHGLATTIVDAFTQGDVSFKKFAADFLKQIAEMIIQAEILLALRSIGLGLAGGGQVSAAAAGGAFMAAGGYMTEASTPTFLPKFNVLAGEAGRELLTVFAQPQRKTINGIAATVGNVGPRQMAVVAANDLAKASSGNSGAPSGSINITVQMAPGLVAGIVQNSVSNAKIAIAQDMQNDTQISRATKRLVA